MIRYEFLCGGELLTYRDVLRGWREEPAFRSFFTGVLAGSSFAAFRWETPALSLTSIDEAFEFVLIDTPSFAKRAADARTFQQYFTDADQNAGVVAFPSLRGDSLMIVPSPRTSIYAYGHLAAFVREAPSEQVDAFWQVLAEQAEEHLGAKKIWLSTAGGGVAWLHARIDPRPKYYHFEPYKK